MAHVIYINGLAWSLHLTESITDFGECDVNARRITLRKTARDQMAITLTHELIHAGWHISDLGDNSGPAGMEETAALRLGEILGGFMLDKRNRDVLKRILGDE